MLAEGVDLIERHLGVKLPSFYVRFVTNYPVLPDGASDIADFDVFDDPRRVTAVNEFVRGRALFELEWPSDLLVIGESGCGDYYAIRINGESEAVFCWNHEIGGFEESARSLEEFVRALIEDC